MTTTFERLFGTSKMAVIGMIHLKALPGTPRFSHSVKEIVEKARYEAEIYTNAGVDAILIENMSDVPYMHARDIGPEVVAAMTRVTSQVREAMPAKTPCGIQILAGGNREALAVAKACDLQFARCEGFVFSHVADEGWMDASAGPLLRYRKQIECEDVLVFADIKKKHSAHSVTSDVTLQETAKAAEFFLADGVILTGTSTGMETDPEDLEAVRKVTQLPTLIGSGVDINNVHKFSTANGLIVGSSFKKTNRWDGELDAQKIRALMKRVEELRGNK